MERIKIFRQTKSFFQKEKTNRKTARTENDNREKRLDHRLTTQFFHPFKQ